MAWAGGGNGGLPLRQPHPRRTARPALPAPEQPRQIAEPTRRLLIVERGERRAVPAAARHCDPLPGLGSVMGGSVHHGRLSPPRLQRGHSLWTLPTPARRPTGRTARGRGGAALPSRSPSISATAPSIIARGSAGWRASRTARTSSATAPAPQPRARATSRTCSIRRSVPSSGHAGDARPAGQGDGGIDMPGSMAE